MRLHHSPPLFLIIRLVQGKALEILLPLTHRCHEMIYFGTADDLLQSQWKLVDDVHWWTFLLFFYMTQCFSYTIHSISILASSFSLLLFIFLNWSFIHSLTSISLCSHSSIVSPLVFCTLVLCHSTDAAFCLAISHCFVVLLCDVALGFVYKGLCLYL